jgi:hypothetical protein
LSHFLTLLAEDNACASLIFVSIFDSVVAFGSIQYILQSGEIENPVQFQKNLNALQSGFQRPSHHHAATLITAVGCTPALSHFSPILLLIFHL